MAKRQTKVIGTELCATLATTAVIGIFKTEISKPGTAGRVLPEYRGDI